MKRLFSGLAALLLVTPAWAESSRPRVVILGDSLTEGYGLQPQDAYPALLQQWADRENLPAEIVNAGVSGDTTADGLGRLSSVLTDEIRILVVALGANDGLRRLPPAQIEVNLRSIIRQSRERYPELVVILAGMRMPMRLGWDYQKEYAALFPRVARSERVLLVPYLLDKVGGIPRLNLEDGMHPNEDGQRLVAENVWKVLEPALRKSR